MLLSKLIEELTRHQKEFGDGKVIFTRNNGTYGKDRKFNYVCDEYDPRGRWTGRKRIVFK